MQSLQGSSLAFVGRALCDLEVSYFNDSTFVTFDDSTIFLWVQEYQTGLLADKILHLQYSIELQNDDVDVT